MGVINLKVLSVNAGSSSLKFSAYEMPEEKLLISGYFERIGMDKSFYTIKVNGEKIKKEVDLPDHEVAFKYLVEELMEQKIVESLDEIKAIGHRSVQGGSISSSVEVSDEVIKTIEDNAPLAPLHNPASIVGIKSAMKVVPNARHVVIFDTSFHTTIPEENYLYPVPREWYTKYRVRRYGFHGTSYRYITSIMQEKLHKEDVNLIICHIGNGASICAVKDGKSINTSMGFTPVSGLMMSTRCGEIDPSIVTYMIENGMSAKEVSNALNKESGLIAIGGYSDSRDIEEGIKNGNTDCMLAQKMLVRRIVNYITNYYVELQECDGIVFTAGLGENARAMREQVLEQLGIMGIKLDKEENNQIASYLDKNEGVITTSDSKVSAYVIPTNEEVMMARDAYSFVK